MTDTVLKYYHQQLDYLREAGNSFSKKHPKTAALLKLDQQGSSDPFVERLLESFALLTAKIQANHDQDQSFLAQSLLNLLYPMATLPLPSITTVQFKPHLDCERAYYLAKNTQLMSNKLLSKKCFFRTGYDLDIMPLALKHQSIQPIVELPEGITGPRFAKAFLLLQFNSTHESFTPKDLTNRPLRIYIKAFKQYAEALTAYLLQHQINCMVQSSHNDNKVSETFENVLSPVGFDQNDLLIPPEKSGYEDCQIFSEYAAYPEKHHYINFNQFYNAAQSLKTMQFDCYVFLDHYDANLVNYMDKTELCLGCAPIINLFETSSKSLVLEPQKSIYPLESNLHLSKEEIEIYKVTQCRVWKQGGIDLTAKSIYQNSFSDRSDVDVVYWEIDQKSCWELGHPELAGTESMIQIHVPLDSKGNVYFDVKMLCTNRDAVLTSNFCQQPDELIVENLKEQTFSIDMLYHPSAPTRSLDTYNINQVLSILAASHQDLFSMSDQVSNGHYFKQMLKALNRSNQQDLTLLIEQIQSIQTQRATLRYPIKNQLIYVSGLEIEILIPAESSQEGALYFFGCAINALCKHYCPINSFMSISIKNQKTGKVISWPPQFL